MASAAGATAAVRRQDANTFVCGRRMLPPAAEHTATFIRVCICILAANRDGIGSV